MDAQPDDPFPARKPPTWRQLPDALSPGMIGVVALLVLARGLASVIEGFDDPSWHAQPWRAAAVGSLSAGIGAAPMLLIVVAVWRRGPRGDRARATALAVAVVASSLLGMCLRLTWGSTTGLGASWDGVVPMFALSLPRNILVGGLLAAALEFWRREQRSVARARDLELEHAAIESERAESLLHLLRAQIEPHFLFNALANVRRLLEHDPTRGRAMLDHLASYLETALPHLRDPAGWTVGREIDLAHAYLELHEVRMGGRLHHEVDVPAALRTVPLLPMTLLTLAENAVKHGIDPLARGGRVVLRARADADRLRLEVSDDGAGFKSGTSAGTGTGLANLRARLAAEYAGAATLSLESNDAGGVTARLDMPRHHAVATA